jgi:hypothetical protein
MQPRWHRQPAKKSNPKSQHSITQQIPIDPFTEHHLIVCLLCLLLRLELKDTLAYPASFLPYGCLCESPQLELQTPLTRSQVILPHFLDFEGWQVETHTWILYVS